MSNSLITMKNIHKSYFLSNGTEIPVLKGIDLEIKQGEFVALMGESGGGKSTLLNIMGFLHPLSQGFFAFAGEDISHFTHDDMLAFIRNRKIGFIFQQYFLIPRLTALQNVMLPSIYAQLPSQEREERARSFLDRVGLSDKLANKPSELSGGQQQRVAIARALINHPDLILADEPTGALDSRTSGEVMELISSLHQEGKTIVMVTHTPEIAKYASRVIFLADGKVVDCDYKSF